MVRFGIVHRIANALGVRIVVGVGGRVVVRGGGRADHGHAGNIAVMIIL